MALLSVSMLLGTAQTGFAQQFNESDAEIQATVVENEIENAVTEKFSEYYSIDDVQLTLCGVHAVQEQTEYFYKVELTVILRYASVEEMDYFQGLVDEAGIDLDEAGEFSCMSRSADEIQAELRPYASAVFNYLDEEYEKLNDYIGKQQIIPIYMKAAVDEQDHVKLFTDAGDDYAPFEEFSLGTRDELKSTGALCMAEEMEEIASVCDSGIMSAEVYAARTNSEVNARFYMIEYSSNPTVCDYCGGSCNAIRDRSKWIPLPTPKITVIMIVRIMYHRH